MRRTPKPDLSDTVSERYKLFMEYTGNPTRHGAIGIICKARPQSKEPIKAKFVDKRKEVKDLLKDALSIMNETIDWFGMNEELKVKELIKDLTRGT